MCVCVFCLFMYFYFVFFCYVLVWERENEDKKRQKNGETWMFFKTTLFGHNIKTKKQHIHLWVHGHHYSCSRVSLHLVKSPNKDFVKNRTMDVERLGRNNPHTRSLEARVSASNKKTSENDHLPWSDFNGPWCKPALLNISFSNSPVHLQPGDHRFSPSINLKISSVSKFPVLSRCAGMGIWFGGWHALNSQGEWVMGEK